MFKGEVFSSSSADFDYEDVNKFIISVTVSDGFLEDMENLTVYITDHNENPVFFNLPDTVSISEHYTGDVLAVDAADPESTPLTYSLSSDPGSGDLLFSIDSSSGMSTNF